VRAPSALATKELPLAGAESMLLVDHGQTKIHELHIVFDECLCADDKGAMS
jgi:hypothetical protein